MTKKMLQGIAAGLLLATSLLAYNYYFTDNLLVIKEVQSEEKMNFTEEDLQAYLESENLVIVEKPEYDQLLENSITLEIVQKEASSKPEKTTEQVIIKEITFQIEPGMSSGSIALLLEEKGLISDKKLFEETLIKKGVETKMKAGEYSLTSEMSIEEIIEKLT
jgi:hypothetical protein